MLTVIRALTIGGGNALLRARRVQQSVALEIMVRCISDRDDSFLQHAQCVTSSNDFRV